MVIDRGFELAGRGVGRTTALLGSAWRFPGQVLAAGGSRRDPDVGRLGALPFDEARHLPAPDGGHLFTTAHGHGPTFLFVHGFAMTSRVWTKQFRDLPPSGFRTLAFDHRGHGASTAAMDETSVDNLADDVRVVVEGLDLRDSVVVGHSMGGMALLAFAVRYPEVAAARLRGMVLVGTAARLGAAQVPMLGRAFVPFTTGFVRSGTWSRSDWSGWAARLLFGKDPVPSQVDLARALLASAREETIVGCARALASFDLSDQLARVALPTLVVNGTADLLTTPGDARHLARGIPDARLELVSGAGHMLMLERSERFAALLGEFAREHGVAAGLAA
ncbi:MAG: alpha/beta fold hydrolase [Actinobacteria bacterium]|nr:alpha/beta fold hydrolase [Actinomycetota bacterium]